MYIVYKCAAKNVKEDSFRSIPASRQQSCCWAAMLSAPAAVRCCDLWPLSSLSLRWQVATQSKSKGFRPTTVNSSVYDVIKRGDWGVL